MPAKSPSRKSAARHLISISIAAAMMAGGCPTIDLPQLNPNNRVPEASAGPDKSVCVGDTAILSAAASADADGDALSYEWTQTQGTQVRLLSAGAISPTFTAASAGLFEFTVTVSDGRGGSDQDTVRVTVTECDEPPGGDVGPRYVLIEGDISWDSARAAAEARGGHLATITSATENALIVEEVLSSARGLNYAIGGIQRSAAAEPLGGWGWVTGEAWLYTNWAAGEPSGNGAGGRESALMIYADRTLNRLGKWNDVPGSVAGILNGYIVEFNE